MGIEERLERIERLLVIGSKEVLNTSEAALMLNVSEQRVRQMMYEKSIPYYKKGGKAYFSKSELENWMLGQRIPTSQEIESEASTLIAIKKV